VFSYKGLTDKIDTFSEYYANTIIFILKFHKAEESVVLYVKKIGEFSNL